LAKIFHVLGFILTLTLEIGSVYACWGKHVTGLIVIAPLFAFTLALILQLLLFVSCVWQMTRTYEDLPELAVHSVVAIACALPLAIMLRQLLQYNGPAQQFLLAFLLPS
jgi:hypothetical protein